MLQLELSEKQLRRIGFAEKTYPADDLNIKKHTFEIKTLNGVFVYNVENTTLRWYHKTIIGEYSNHVLLDITDINTLYILLKSFKVLFLDLNQTPTG